VTLLLCPSLEQELCLGIDFWREFRIAPHIFDIEVITPEENEKRKKIEPEPHELDTDQEAQVQEIWRSFLSYEEHGLGWTSVKKHTSGKRPSLSGVSCSAKADL